mgnify:CR=1 FL=1
MLYDTTKKPPNRMESLGQILRRERERRGLTIDALAEQTRINAAYFRAIEAGDKQSLPGGFFYRSFLRQYARLLELPESVYESEIARSLEEETQAPPAVLPDRHIDVPPLPTGAPDRAAETRRWLVRVAALVAVVAVATMLYAVYLRWRTPVDVAQEIGSQAPPIAMPVEAEPPPAPAAAETAAPGSAPDEAAETKPAGMSAEPVTGPVRLRLAAREPVWVEVWADGRRVFNDLMKAADSRSFGAQARIRVLLGNAGGMDLVWNDEALAPVGPRGQVRTVEFGAESYQIITPVPRAPASQPESQQSEPA